MIAANFAAFSNTAGRFHRNIITVPQVADGDDLNPYTMLTRSQANRRSSDMHLSESPPALNAASKGEKPLFITNRTMRNFGDLKKQHMR